MLMYTSVNKELILLKPVVSFFSSITNELNKESLACNNVIYHYFTKEEWNTLINTSCTHVNDEPIFWEQDSVEKRDAFCKDVLQLYSFGSNFSIDKDPFILYLTVRAIEKVSRTPINELDFNDPEQPIIEEMIRYMDIHALDSWKLQGYVDEVLAHCESHIENMVQRPFAPIVDEFVDVLLAGHPVRYKGLSHNLFDKLSEGQIKQLHLHLTSNKLDKLRGSFGNYEGEELARWLRHPKIVAELKQRFFDNLPTLRLTPLHENEKPVMIPTDSVMPRFVSQAKTFLGVK